VDAADTQIQPPQPPAGALLRYRNRVIRPEDVAYVESLVGQGLSRSQIYRAVCAAWGWHQPNGRPSIQGCQDLLLRLQERGYLRLPAGYERRRREPPLLPPDLIPIAWLPVTTAEADLHSLTVRPITPEERLGFRIYMERYHYVGWRRMVGEHLLYAAFLGSELVALLGWSGAALQAPLRDAHIGWDAVAKRRGLRFLANNVRFLVFPWVRVKNLASKILAHNVRRLSADWQQAWGHPVWLAETFVDTSRFGGTCYRAANWLLLGESAGRTRRANSYLRGGTPKALFVYPLRRKAVEALCRVAQAAP
jgi:hypothetical protein